MVGPYGGRYSFLALRAETAPWAKIAVFRVSRLGIDMEGSLLRLKSFIPRREKLPFEYGQISMLTYHSSGKSPLDMGTGTLIVK